MTDQSTFPAFIARLRGFIRQTSSIQAAPTATGTQFQQLALELFALQFAHNPAYRRLCQSRHLSPEIIRDWRDIPAVPTAAFKELELSSLPAAERARVFYSSGTTGQRPSRHFHNAESLALYEASLLPWFQTHLLGPEAGSLNFVILTPSPKDSPHSSLVQMFATVAREFVPDRSRFTGRVDAAGNWDLDLPATLAALNEAAAANHPAVVLGTAFNFAQLLEHMAATEKSLRLPAGSRVLETGGYKGRSRALPKAELHGQITYLLGVPGAGIVSEYGMSELSSQAYDHTFAGSKPTVSVFRFPPWARAQVVSPETGREVQDAETGLIRIFDLANVRSVMAVQTEDLGIRRGDGFQLLGRALPAEARGCSLMSA